MTSTSICNGIFMGGDIDTIALDTTKRFVKNTVVNHT
jgi:hypothetical protein